MNNASAFFGAPPPPIAPSSRPRQEQQHTNSHSQRGAMHGGGGIHSRPMTMMQQQPPSSSSSAPPPPPRYHQPPQQQQQQPSHYGAHNIASSSSSGFGSGIIDDDEFETFETLDLNNNSDTTTTTNNNNSRVPPTAMPMPMIGSTNNSTSSSNTTSATTTSHFIVRSSSGPENFSNYPPPAAAQNPYHPHQQQQQRQDRTNNKYREEDITFEYEGGVALQTALNVFGSVASVAGGLAGGLLAAATTGAGAGAAAAGGVSSSNAESHGNNYNARMMMMGRGGGGGTTSMSTTTTTKNLVGNVASWGGRIVDVVAPTTTSTTTTTYASATNSTVMGRIGASGVLGGSSSSHRRSNSSGGSPVVVPPLPPQQQQQHAPHQHVPRMVGQHHNQQQQQQQQQYPPPQPHPPSPMYHHHQPTPTMQIHHHHQQQPPPPPLHRRQSSVASNNSSEAHELFGAAPSTPITTTTTTTTTFMTQYHAPPATTTTTTTTAAAVMDHVRQSSSGSGGVGVSGTHHGREGGTSASDFFASSSSVGGSVSSSMGQPRHPGSTSGSSTAGDFFNAVPPTTPTLPPSTSSIIITNESNSSNYNNKNAPPTPPTAIMFNTAAVTNDDEHGGDGGSGRRSDTTGGTANNESMLVGVSVSKNDSIPVPAAAAGEEVETTTSLAVVENVIKSTEMPVPSMDSMMLASASAASSSSSTTSQRQQKELQNNIPLSMTSSSGGDQSSSVTTTTFVAGKIVLPSPSKAIIATTSNAAAAVASTTTRQHYLPLPPPLPARKKTPLISSTTTAPGDQSTTTGLLFPSGTMERPTTTFRKPPPIPGSGGSNASTPRFHVPSPRVSPRMSPMTTTASSSTTGTPVGVGRRHAVAGGSGGVVAISGGGGGGNTSSTPLHHSLGEGTASATTSPAVGMPPPVLATTPRVDVHQSVGASNIHGNDVSPMVSIPDLIESNERELKLAPSRGLVVQSAVSTTMNASVEVEGEELHLTDMNFPAPPPASGTSSVNFNDDVDWNSVAKSMGKVEDAVHKVSIVAPPPPIPPEAVILPHDTTTSRSLFGAPPPVVKSSNANDTTPIEAETPIGIDPAIFYSSTSPPIYPNNQFPRTPSSRVTECDVMSDYQMQVCEEDFPDVVLPSPGSQHAGGDVVSDAEVEVTTTDATSFGVDNEMPPNLQYQHNTQLSETSSEYIAQSSSVIDAECTSAYRDVVTEDVFVSSQTSGSRVDNVEAFTLGANDVGNPSDGEPPLLPEGWVESFDANTGRVYFYNERTGASSWDRPMIDDISASVDADVDKDKVAAVGLPTAAVDREAADENTNIESIQLEAGPLKQDDAEEEALPMGWEKVVDPTTEQVYYFNPTTGISSWDYPSNHTQDEGLAETTVTIDVAEAAVVSLSTQEMVEVSAPTLNVDETMHTATATTASESESSATKEEVSMPEGWIESCDQTTGEIYYYNEISGISQWHRPASIIEKDAVDELLDGHIVNDAAADGNLTAEAVLPQSVSDEEPDDSPSNEDFQAEQVAGAVLQSDDGKMTAKSPESTSAYNQRNGYAEDTASILSFESLPAGWIEAIDNNTGLTYYYNEENNETSWDRPVADEITSIENKGDSGDAALKKEIVDASNSIGAEHVAKREDIDHNECLANATGADEGSDFLPIENHQEGDWAEITDPDTGDVYYFNRTTNETSWTKPGQNIAETQSSKEVENSSSSEVPVAVFGLEEHVSTVNHEVASGQNIVEKSSPLEEAIDEGWTKVDHPPPATSEEVVEIEGSIDDRHEASDDGKLPDGWQELVDPNTSKVYYFNELSNTTSWTPPEPPESEIVKEFERELESEDESRERDVDATAAGPLEQNIHVTGDDLVLDGEQLDEVIEQPKGTGQSTTDTSIPQESNNSLLPKGWMKGTDSTSGETYYFNESTGESSWDRPVITVDSIVKGAMTDVDVSPVTTLSSPMECFVEEELKSQHQPDDLVLDQAFGHGEQLDEVVEQPKGTRRSTTDTSIPQESNDSLLPEGWMQGTDSTSGETYYFNESTGESSWDRPVITVDSIVEGAITGADVSPVPELSSPTEDFVEEELKTQQQSDGPTPSLSDMSLQDGWVEVNDPSSGGTYYYNESLAETTWDRPIKKRSRPAHAIATFGFGGRLCVMIPQVAAALSGSVTGRRDSQTTMRRGPVVIHRICNLIPHDHVYSIPSAATPSSPLVQTNEQEVLTYLKTKSSDPEDLLWKVIDIAAQNGGKLRSDKRAQQAIRDLLLDTSCIRRLKSGKPTKDHIPLESSASNLDAVQDLIIRGQREDAVDEAVAQENYALALLIASMCDRDTFRMTAKCFADKVLPIGSPLYTVALLFSENMNIPDDEEISDPYGKRAPKRSLWYDDDMYEDLGQNWKEQLASMLSNKKEKWETIVLSLGDRLNQLGHCHAAHVCYLMSSSSFGSPLKDSTRLVLIGCDHRRCMNQLLMTPQSIQSFERTEAFEWARRRGNRNSHIPSLQPFKLRYAELLADFGREELARAYLLSIRSSIGIGSDTDKGKPSSGNTRSTIMKDTKFIEALEKLDDRICVSTGAERTSWNHNNKSRGSATSLVLSSFVKSVLVKKPKADDPAITPDAADYDDLSPREPGPSLPEPSLPESGFLLQQIQEPIKSQTEVIVASTPVGGEEPSVVTKNSFDDHKGLSVGNVSSGLSTNDHRGPPSSAPPIFGGGAMKKDIDVKSTTTDEDERDKAAIPPTPRLAGNKDEKTKAPVSEPPRSAGWLSKLLRRDGESKATVADVGEDMQAYYDEKLKCWIFPGDDPAEVAKPLAPPPIVPKTPVAPTPSAPAACNDPLAALMAPPPTRGLSTMKKGTSAATRYADPMSSTGKKVRASSASAGGKAIPPTSPMMATPPTFAVFQPQPTPAG